MPQVLTAVEIQGRGEAAGGQRRKCFLEEKERVVDPKDKWNEQKR